MPTVFHGLTGLCTVEGVVLIHVLPPLPIPARKHSVVRSGRSSPSPFIKAFLWHLSRPRRRIKRWWFYTRCNRRAHHCKLLCAPSIQQSQEHRFYRERRLHQSSSNQEERGKSAESHTRTWYGHRPVPCRVIPARNPRSHQSHSTAHADICLFERSFRRPYQCYPTDSPRLWWRCACHGLRW